MVAYVHRRPIDATVRNRDSLEVIKFRRGEEDLSKLNRNS